MHYEATFRNMIKYLFSVINPLLLLFISFLRGEGDVVISNTIPSNIQAGNEVQVEFKIKKGSISDFAIFEVSLPENFIALGETEHSKGTTYTYKGNTVKWQWDTLSEAEELLIKFSFMATEEAVGNKRITAQFFYEEDNEKKTVDMPVALLRVLSQSAETPGQPEVEARQEPAGAITATRTITRVSSKEFLVRIKINKGMTTGFAKYTDEALDNYIYWPRRTEGSTFSIADGKIKFVWVNVPDVEVLEISYSITRNYISKLVLHGEYSYLEKNESKKYVFKTDEIENTEDKEEQEQVAQQDTVKPLQETNQQTDTSSKAKVEKSVAENNKSKQDTFNKAAAPKVSGEQLATDEPKKTKNKTKQPAEIIEKKDGEVNYMIQIGAFSKSKVNAGSLQTKFKISESIKSEMQDGFSKFMVGSHSEYKAARDHREQMRTVNGVKTAFVVAYSGVKRITVQEALMITNQKWFK